MERVGLWTNSRKTFTSQSEILSCGRKPGQVKIQGTARNLPRNYKKDNENTKTSLQNGQRLGNTDEDTEKIGLKKFLAFKKSARS